MGNIMDIFDLSIKRNEKILFSNISFSVLESSTTAILCPNNSGKTTLIRTLSGIDSHSNGKIIVNKIILNKNNFSNYILSISTILEDIDNQFVCYNVEDELRYPLENLKFSKREINKILSKIITNLKLKKLLDKKISELSYLEKIKVLIAASISHSPKIIFVDDILRFLNYYEKKDVIKIFKILNEQFNITVLFTTSDLNDVIDVDDVIVINDGKIVMHDSFYKIILRDNELSKIGFSIPIMIDLSRKLQFYNLVDNIYFDADKLVNNLWK